MNEIYTSTGPMLLALNPFKELKGIYSEDLMRRYCERGQKMLSGSSVPVKKKGGLPSSDNEGRRLGENDSDSDSTFESNNNNDKNDKQNNNLNIPRGKNRTAAERDQH